MNKSNKYMKYENKKYENKYLKYENKCLKYENKCLKPEDVDIVFYHAKCADGTGSAFAFWLYNGGINKRKNIEYYPMFYGMTPPQIQNKNIVICDFSFKKNILLDIMQNSNKLLVIDHHISAQRELEEIPNENKLFDMNHSGAYLTWKFCFPKKKVPKMIKYIEDRDLFRNSMENTNAFKSWFFTLDHDFEIYNKYIDDDLLDKKINKIGIYYEELNKYYIKNQVEQAIPKFTKIGDKYFFIGYLNSTILISDIGNKILNYLPCVDFSAIFYIDNKKNTTKISLRSGDKYNQDVSIIAEMMGGGGHKYAAGLTLKYITNKLDGIEYDNGELYELLKNIYIHETCILKKEINIVYINCPIYKKEIANYLLQERYIDENNLAIQEVLYIYRHLTGKNKYIEFKIALIWDYDGINDITKYTILYKNDDNYIYRNIEFEGIKKLLELDILEKIIYEE